MDTIKPKYIVGLLAVAALTTACSEKMPIVSEENCKQENIQQIEDDQIREKFSDQCFDYRVEQGKEKASSLLEQSQEKSEELYEEGTDAAKKAYDSTTDAMEDAADAVNEAWDDAKDSANETMDKINDAG